MLKRLCAIALICATTATAQEVRLITDEAEDALNSASLLLALDADAAPQDFVAAARADYRRLLTALYGQGYYGGTISITVDGREAANIAPLDAPRRIGEVVITVDAGAQFTFGDVRIAPLPPQATVSEDIGPDRVAQASVIGAVVRDGINRLRDRGYAKTRVADQRVTARHRDATLDVDVALETGPRLTFGPMSVAGLKSVTADRIREIAGLPVGEVFSPQELDAAAARLRRTGTFASVSLREADQIGPDNSLPINAQISSANPRRIGFGIELSSIEGVTLSSFWLHRNLLGGAERIRVDAEVSGISGETGGIDYRLSGTFTRPATFGADTDFFISAEVSREDEPSFLIDKIGVETGLTRRISDELTVRAAVGVLRAREETAFSDRDYVLLTLPLDVTLDRRDDASNAANGYYIDLGLTPFISTDGEIAGGQVYTDARAYRSFGEADQMTLAGRVQIGSVLGAALDVAPADYLFYSGGGGTVRGQAYQSLGINSVQDGQDVTTGGTSFLGAQLEARYKVREKIALVGFYDFGQVGVTAIPGEDAEWHAGAGVGLRYDTGIGPIRLDLGTQASGDDAGQDLQVYIGIGQAF